MSDSGTPPETPGLPPPKRSGWMTGFMLMAGVILLLPGICSLIFSNTGPSNPLVGLGMMIGAFGIILIVLALWR
jgi:hypothetical protein